MFNDPRFTQPESRLTPRRNIFEDEGPEVFEGLPEREWKLVVDKPITRLRFAASYQIFIGRPNPGVTTDNLARRMDGMVQTSSKIEISNQRASISKEHLIISVERGETRTDPLILFVMDTSTNGTYKLVTDGEVRLPKGVRFALNVGDTVRIGEADDSIFIQYFIAEDMTPYLVCFPDSLNYYAYQEKLQGRSLDSLVSSIEG